MRPLAPRLFGKCSEYRVESETGRKVELCKVNGLYRV
jgi:hypothetical protein